MSEEVRAGTRAVPPQLPG